MDPEKAGTHAVLVGGPSDGRRVKLIVETETSITDTRPGFLKGAHYRRTTKERDGDVVFIYEGEA